MKKAFSRKNLWDKLPGPIKSVAGMGLSRVPLGWLLGKTFRRHHWFCQQTQWWSAERLRDYQLQELGELLIRAGANSAFYRRVFAEAGFDPHTFADLADLAALPTMDKQTVLEHGADMLTVPADGWGIDYTSTGGTSGQPLQFYIGKERSAIEYAYLVASWERAGYRLGMVKAVLRGFVVEPDESGLYHQYDPLLRHHYYSAFHLNEANMARYLDHIATIGPCVLHVYPSSVSTLARYLKSKGQTPPSNIRGIIAESEIVYPQQRALVEEVFGIRLFSCYGHTEKLVLTAECEKSHYDHVWPTYGYFELLDEAGRAVTEPGQRGEIVGTGFINKVMPFIRYRTGDYATYVADRCEACGRNHPLITEIRGHRTQESLIAADGSEISWTALNMHDDTFATVRQFQFVQDTPGRAVLKVVPGQGHDEAAEQRIRRNMTQKLADRVEFTIETVETIPLSPRGKAIYVDQRINRE